MSTHYICFCREIRKNKDTFWLKVLFGWKKHLIKSYGIDSRLLCLAFLAIIFIFPRKQVLTLFV